MDRLLEQVRDRVRADQRRVRGVLQRLLKNNCLFRAGVLLHLEGGQEGPAEPVPLPGAPCLAQEEGESVRALQGLPVRPGREQLPRGDSARVGAGLRQEVVPSQARGHFQAQQQVGAGAVRGPERDPDKFCKEARALHEQAEGEERVLPERRDAEREPGADQEVAQSVIVGSSTPRRC